MAEPYPIDDDEVITAYYVLAHEFDGRTVDGQSDLNKAMLETKGWYGSSFIRFWPELGAPEWADFSPLVSIERCDDLGYVTARD